MSRWTDFVELAEELFSPLEKQYGFHKVAKKEPFLSYESDKIRIDIFYEPSRRCELDLGIERLRDVGKGKPSYGIGRVVHLNGGKTKTAPFPCNREELQIELTALKDNLFKYATDIISGNLKDLDRLDEIEEKYN